MPDSIITSSFDTAHEIASPCVKVCRLDAAGGCLGCGRNREEIAAWPYASNTEKQSILDAASLRLSS